MFTKHLFNRLQHFIRGSYDLEGQSALLEMRVIYINFTMFMAAISSPVIGILHLGHWFSYSSTVHGINCLIFSAFQLVLLRYCRRSIDNFVVSRNLLLLSLFLIFTSNLVFSVNEDMRILWFAILLIVAQGLGGARIRNIVAGSTAILFTIYLQQPLDALNLTATDVISSLLLLALAVILFDYYDFTIQSIMRQMERAKRDALHMAGVKTRFLSSMSHEIRTPLNGIIGFTDMLLKDEADPLKVERLNYIRSSGRVLTRLIGNVLDLSKIDDGKMTIERRCYDLRKELEAISIFAVTAQDKRIAFTINVSSEVPEYLIGDSLRLNQVLNNLINNAIRFTSDGGKVGLTIDLSRDGRSLDFEVSDTGVGIPLEKQALVFSPFMLLDESTGREFGGTGLGLSISSRLVELMEGELHFVSREGEGSRFFFSLPLEICQCEQHAPATVRAPELCAKAINVLVVEDDSINQVLMRDFLERMGHAVTIVENGREALSACKQDHYDLILMDISMPVMDGVEATKALRAQGINVPIIALTANIFKEDVEHYLASGMTHCISKPVDIEQLEQLVHTFCEEDS